MKKIHADEGSPLHPKLGPYFRDGHRRVDYILEYSIQKPNSARRHSTIFGNDNFLRRLRRSLSTRNSKAPLQPKEDPEFAAQEHRADYHEDDKSNKRKEFEENLQEAGLELEWDEEVRVVERWLSGSRVHLILHEQAQRGKGVFTRNRVREKTEMHPSTWHPYRKMRRTLSNFS